MKSSENEIKLIKQAQAGSERAFNQLFYRYQTFVDKQLIHYIKDEDEAKDLTNIVFIKVKNNLSKFTDYNTFGGWLRIIARNTAIDYLRIRSNKNKFKPKTDDFTKNVEISSSDDVISSLEIKDIEKYLLKKSKKQYEVFHCIASGLTPLETAKALNMNHNNVKSIISRLRPKLIKIFNY